jgi:integrase
MPEATLTAGSVATLKATPGVRVNYFDTHPEAPSGFVLRVTETSRVYYLLATFKGRRVWVRIGTVQGITLKDARRAARARAGELALGRDVNAEKRAEARRLAAQRSRGEGWTLLDMVQEYIKARPMVSRATVRSRASLVHCHMKTWTMPARDVVREDVRRLLRPLAKSHPAQAGRALALLRTAFRWAMDEEVITDVDGQKVRRSRVDRDPTRRIEGEIGLSGYIPRKRTLSDAEIETFWESLDGVLVRRAALGRIILLCGTRVTETFLTRWVDVDLDVKIWHIPAKNRKGKPEGMPGERRHLDVPLSPLAVTVFQGLPRDEERVFGARDPSRAADDWRKASGIGDVTPHDLRRTCATGLQRIGCPPHVISVVLGHAREQGATQTDAAYTHDRRLSEHRVWLERWATHVEGLIKN